jgi:hypothetical protein
MEFSFAEYKELKVIFFICNWFDSIHRIRHNQFGIVEIKHNAKLLGNNDFVLAHQVEQVYYLSYPCEKLDAWRVVTKWIPVNGYILLPMLLIMMMNKLMRSIKKKNCQPLLFLSPDVALDSLVKDSVDVTIL